MRPSGVFIELDKILHDRKGFDCGTGALNTFLQQYAVRHRAAGISKTMVLSSQDNPADICAYYTISHTEVKRETMPRMLAKKLPRYPIPVMLIAQLAISTLAQGRRLGKATLIRALEHCYTINQHLPSNAVVVDALDQGVQGFYEQYGFQTLDTQDRKIRLFLPMGTVARLFSS